MILLVGKRNSQNKIAESLKMPQAYSVSEPSILCPRKGRKKRKISNRSGPVPRAVLVKKRRSRKEGWRPPCRCDVIDEPLIDSLRSAVASIRILMRYVKKPRPSVTGRSVLITRAEQRQKESSISFAAAPPQSYQ